MKRARPPDKETARHANAAGHQDSRLGERTDDHRSERRSEFQGLTNARNRKQAPPRWERPRQADALDDLQRVFGAPARRFVVRCQKSSGKFIEYGRYIDRDEAMRVATMLRWAGAVARVETAGGSR